MCHTDTASHCLWRGNQANIVMIPGGFSAGGYVIAWFRWQLMGDEEAARAFISDSPELMNNSMYQNQRIDLGEQP